MQKRKECNWGEKVENSVTGGKKEENSVTGKKKLTLVFLDPIQNSVAAKIVHWG